MTAAAGAAEAAGTLAGQPWWTAALVVLPGTVSAVAAVIAAQRSRRVDDAVNHRHKDEPRLLDLVRRIDQRLDQHIAWHLDNGPGPDHDDVARMVVAEMDRQRRNQT